MEINGRVGKGDSEGYIVAEPQMTSKMMGRDWKGDKRGGREAVGKGKNKWKGNVKGMQWRSESE